MDNFIGLLLFKLGFKYKVTTDITGSKSVGYGKLDDNGFWKYPIYGSLRRRKRRRVVMNLKDFIKESKKYMEYGKGISKLWFWVCFPVAFVRYLFLKWVGQA